MAARLELEQDKLAELLYSANPTRKMATAMARSITLG
jgi:hypothetical protein